jgi:hypothetical protein
MDRRWNTFLFVEVNGHREAAPESWIPNPCHFRLGCGVVVDEEV